MLAASPEQIAAFIERWQQFGAAERANYASFLVDRCFLLHLGAPQSVFARQQPKHIRL